MEIGEKVIFLGNSSVVSMMTMLTLITLPLLRKGRKNAFLTLKFLYLGPKANFLFWNRDISSHGHLTNTPGTTPQKFSTRKKFPFPRRVSFSEAHPGFWPFRASVQSQVFILIGTLVLDRGLRNLKSGRNYILLKRGFWAENLFISKWTSKIC